VLIPLITGLMALAAPDSAAQEEEMQLAEPFRNPYAADDATGDHVIALWQFDAGAEAQDASGNGHELELRGAAFATEGRFGAAL
jgi:hypothetical protein